MKKRPFKNEPKIDPDGTGLPISIAKYKLSRLITKKRPKCCLISQNLL